MDNPQTATSKDGNAQSQATGQQTPEDDWQQHIAKLLAYSGELKDDYKTQAKLTQQVARAEWRLSLRSLALISIFLVCFASGLVLLWAGFLGAIGYALYDLFASVWLSIATVILLQITCLIWLWKNTRYLSNKIGFAKTLRSVKQLLS
jgi:hypothetical protein